MTDTNLMTGAEAALRLMEMELAGERPRMTADERRAAVNLIRTALAKAVEAEREACAQACERGTFIITGQHYANLIRARSKA